MSYPLDKTQSSGTLFNLARQPFAGDITLSAAHKLVLQRQRIVNALYRERVESNNAFDVKITYLDPHRRFIITSSNRRIRANPNDTIINSGRDVDMHNSDMRNDLITNITIMFNDNTIASAPLGKRPLSAMVEKTVHPGAKKSSLASIGTHDRVTYLRHIGILPKLNQTATIKQISVNFNTPAEYRQKLEEHKVHVLSLFIGPNPGQQPAYVRQYIESDPPNTVKKVKPISINPMRVIPSNVSAILSSLLGTNASSGGKLSSRISSVHSSTPAHSKRTKHNSK